MLTSDSGEIRINGRAIQHGLYNEIWGKALHPSQNRFLAQIDILSDQAAALPDTKSTKDGLREAVLIAQRHPDTVKALLAILPVCTETVSSFFPRKLSPRSLNTVASSKMRSSAHRSVESSLKSSRQRAGFLLLVKTMLKLPSLL